MSIFSKREEFEAFISNLESEKIEDFLKRDMSKGLRKALLLERFLRRVKKVMDGTELWKLWEEYEEIGRHEVERAFCLRLGIYSPDDLELFSISYGCNPYGLIKEWDNLTEEEIFTILKSILLKLIKMKFGG